MSRDKDIRKSNFVAVTSLASTDTFDLVRSGQNFKITFSDMIAALGVCGSLVAAGDAEAIPVLNVDGTINNIRGILGGSGIVTSLSVGGAVKVGHNFTVDTTGASILRNEAADSPTLRSIVGGTGITVAESGNTVTISESGSPGTTKTVYVYEESDFPTPSAGVITLEDDTEYYLLNDVETDYRFAIGSNTVLTGSDGTLIELKYTGALAMFTSADKSWKIKDLIITCTSGTVFDVSSTTSAHLLRIYTSQVSCLNLGDFDGLGLLVVDKTTFVATGTGFTFTGSLGIVIFSICSLTIASGTGDGFDLGTATFNSFSLESFLFDIDTSGYCLTGAAASANINAGGLGTVINCQQVGSADFLNGNISQYDDLWAMHFNPDIINSVDLALATHGGATITITTQDAPVKITGTWTSQDMNRFTHDNAGKWTYNGKGCHLSVNVSLSGAAAAVSDTFRFYIYKNGAQIAASMVSREFDTSIGNISMLWELELATDDYIELYVENHTDTRDFVVDAATIRLRS